MAITLKNIMKKLPAERRKRIEARAAELIAECHDLQSITIGGLAGFGGVSGSRGILQQKKRRGGGSSKGSTAGVN